ncbi:Curli assembly protein CsgE [Reichenbachiella faecimaris]|uniref:Curli production assembly/transport component CsgE n=1 Tax=Reichenbachiella faecimaris TaxID=692418 RepID=A0A1W2GJM2_REIFA|nr:CsgE family curli-type amyloid fiber assembly protein [Reichenbachiella faecimaris]SMD36855.1 Curli assembly protein CsgE [Reichenbachiella faecimaris]
MSIHLLIGTLTFSLLSFQTLAQIEDELDGNLLVEIDELIVDQSLSKSGHDFYEIFYSQWIWPEVDGFFTIYIKERPARANSTQVQVYVNELLVFENILQPSYESLVSLSDYASRYVRRHIVSYEEVLRELQGEDMSGTGIY